MSSFTLCTIGVIIACLILDQQSYRRKRNREIARHGKGFHTALLQIYENSPIRKDSAQSENEPQ